MPETAQIDITRSILEQLLLLRLAGAFSPTETTPGCGVWNWRFRSGGWPVDVVLDRTVMELRVYHGRDEVAMGRVTDRAMDLVLGREVLPRTAEPVPSAEETLAELRKIVARWKAGNARIFISPPHKVGHPDNWNRA